MEEDLELPDVIQNPYYGADVEMESVYTDNSNTTRDVNHTEIITCTENTYYEM